MRSRVELEPAFVLHRRPFRESSLLLEVLSAGQGRVGLVARGARGPKSRLRTVLQPFHRVLLSWSGRGELATLTRAEPDGPSVQPSPELLAHAFYLNELTIRLLHRYDPHAEVFDAYATALGALCAREGPAEASLRVFEKRLLEALGYGLVLGHEAEHGAAIEAGVVYDYRRELGPVAADAVTQGCRVTGRTLLAIAAERLDDEVSLREARVLLRYVLAPHLGDRPLGSRALLGARRSPDALHESLHD